MILAILQARFTSSRLPGKVLKPLLGKPMLARQIERIQKSKKINKLVIATSNEESDAPIAELGKTLQIPVFRGSLNDVLDRFYRAALLYPAHTIVRLTGDCPLIDPQIIDAIVTKFESSNCDYMSNSVEATFPDGLDVEVCKMSALERAWKEAELPSQREHVMPYIHSTGKFNVEHYKNHKNLSHLRWTVDNAEDFKLVETIYNNLYPTNPDFNTQDILNLLDQHKELLQINSHFIRNEGLLKSLKQDEVFKQKRE